MLKYHALWKQQKTELRNFDAWEIYTLCKHSSPLNVMWHHILVIKLTLNTQKNLLEIRCKKKNPICSWTSNSNKAKWGALNLEMFRFLGTDFFSVWVENVMNKKNE